jgi:hypothetical protein
MRGREGAGHLFIFCSKLPPELQANFTAQHLPSPEGVVDSAEG